MKKSHIIGALTLYVVVFTLSSCAAVEGIFKAGVGVGIFIVLFVFVILGVVAMKVAKK